MEKWFIRLALGIPGLMAAIVILAAVAFRLANRTNGRLVSSGVKRTYLLYVPKSYDPSRPTPLVITIHGLAQWPANQMQVSRWNDLADEYGFIVVYPSGTQFPMRWQAYSNSPGSPNPDVQFISDLIDKIERDYNIDPTRIYANGLSNGAGMAFLLACQMPERIAAIGLVGGAYLLLWEACQLPRPVPAIVFHGTADPVVPFRGGRSRSFNVPFPAIPQWVEALARHTGCQSAPEALPSDGAVSGVRYPGGGEGEVVFYTIKGGGHTWPGGRALPRWIAGHTTQDIEASRVMWDFFSAHPLPSSPPAPPPCRAGNASAPRPG